MILLLLLLISRNILLMDKFMILRITYVPRNVLILDNYLVQSMNLHSHIRQLKQFIVKNLKSLEPKYMIIITFKPFSNVKYSYSLLSMIGILSLLVSINYS